MVFNILGREPQTNSSIDPQAVVLESLEPQTHDMTTHIIPAPPREAREQ